MCVYGKIPPPHSVCPKDANLPPLLLSPLEFQTLGQKKEKRGGKQGSSPVAQIKVTVEEEKKKQGETKVCVSLLHIGVPFSVSRSEGKHSKLPLPFNP